MLLTLAAVTSRSLPKSSALEALTHDYLTRTQRLNPIDTLNFPSEPALLAHAVRAPSRPAATLLLFHSAGDLLTSERFAQLLAQLRDTATPRLMLSIGPADGWSPAALSRATHTLSFGRITLPHALARLVAAEQIYRAFTILSGHPYHTGH